VAETALKTLFDAKKYSSTANPLDAVFSKGLNAAFSDDEFTLKDANSIGQFIAMAGSLAGRPELTLIPAVIRGTMQLSNAADNLIETDTEERSRLLREHAKEAKTETDKQKDTYDDVVSKALSATDPNKRNAILSTLDEKTRAKARTAIDKAEKQSTMTEDEITLSKMAKTRRTEAVTYVYNNLSEPAKTAYALRIKDLFDIDLIPPQE
jgi:cobalamin biosynthesis protein CbiD